MWLVLNDSGMSKGEQELECSGKENERGNLHKVDRCRNYQTALLEDEFNQEFWAKVMKMKCTLKVEHFLPIHFPLFCFSWCVGA